MSTVRAQTAPLPLLELLLNDSRKCYIFVFNRRKYSLEDPDKLDRVRI